MSPRSPRAWYAAGVGVATLGFAWFSVLAHQVPYFAWDVAITGWVQGPRAGWIDAALWPLDAIGFPPLAGVFYGSIVLLIYLRGARWEAAGAAMAALGGMAMNHLVKAIVMRPRPVETLAHVDHHLPGYTFPAGHVLNFTVFAGFLCYLACVRLAPSWRRTGGVILLVTLILLMGVARIRAGEHWPSDVLGGYWCGLLWLAATVEFYRWGRRRRARGAENLSSTPGIRAHERSR